MTAARLAQCSLLYYWRGPSAVALATAIATAALCGALLVGDSMRASLRQQALAGLTHFEFAIRAERTFRSDLAKRLLQQAGFVQGFRVPATAYVTQASVVHARNRGRVSGVQVLAVDEPFWSSAPGVAAIEPAPPRSREIQINQALADELGAGVGDDVVLHLGRPSAVSADTFMGRGEDRAVSVRLQVRGIVPNEGLGSFSLSARQAAPRNAFLALETLQRVLQQPRRANSILLAPKSSPADRSAAVAALAQQLVGAAKIEDYGLNLVQTADAAALSLESDALLVPTDVEQAAGQEARKQGLAVVPLYSYLATNLSAVDPSASRSTDRAETRKREAPYSVITGLPVAGPPLSRMTRLEGSGPATIVDGGVVLNAWTAEQLGARTGDVVRVDYLVRGEFGALLERSVERTVSDIVALEGAAEDRQLVPNYPGITDAKRLTEWDPPFPVDLRRIRPQDEEYWERNRTAPKAYVSLGDAQQLWVTSADTHGHVTSMRFYPQADGALDRSSRDAFAEKLAGALAPATMGVRIEDLRARAMAASAGATDFGGLFGAFSSFLILAAAALVGLLFRLGAEQRASEIGLLLALGWPRQAVRTHLLGQGAVVALIGCTGGLGLALAYAALMIHALQTWWAGAAEAPFLSLHPSWISLVGGGIGGLALALGAMAWSLRGLTRRWPRDLLRGAIGLDPPLIGARLAWRVSGVALVASLMLLLVPVVSSVPPSAPTFFLVGAGLLTSALAAACGWLRSGDGRGRASGLASRAQLGLQNLRRNPGRSLLVLVMLASAVFVITATEAFRLHPSDIHDRRGGVGGYTYIGESSAAVHTDLNLVAGRSAAGLGDSDSALWEPLRTWAMRLRPGDETSCRNLYRTSQPRIVGAPREFLMRGGFSFAGSLARARDERANPWLLLDRAPADGAIPAIGDEAAVLWQLHSGLGQRLEITDERGRARPLRFVALLSGSVLQGEIIVSEPNFRGLFPSLDGYRFFLIEADAGSSPPPAAALEAGLEAYGLDLESTRKRLGEYFAVQNTYLSAFQALGGLGVLLGTFGLSVIMLRNVLERRRELALLHAIGFSRGQVGELVFLENLWLVILGLACGLLPALVAVAPQLQQRVDRPGWQSFVLLLFGIVVVGCLSGVLAARAALGVQPAQALRNE